MEAVFLDENAPHNLLLENAAHEFRDFTHQLNASYWVYFSTHFEKNRGVDFEKQDFGTFNDKFSSDAARLVFYQDAQLMLAQLDNDHAAIPILLQEKRPLAQIYDEWLGINHNTLEDIECTLDVMVDKLEAARQHEAEQEEKQAQAEKPAKGKKSKAGYEPGGR